MPVSERDFDLMRPLRPPLGFLPRTAQSRVVATGALGAFALLGGGIEPLVFTAFTTAVLVALVVFKLWSAHGEAVANEHAAAVRAVDA